MSATPLETAMSRLINQHPFFAVLLARQMKIVESDTAKTAYGTCSVPTAATDGKTIWINPDFFASLTPDECVFVLAHEVGHYIFDHMQRAKLYKNRGFGPDLKEWNHQKWNFAGDYIINSMLEEANVGTMPEQGLYRRDVTGESLCDEVYMGIENPPDNDSDDGDGSNGGGGFDQHMDPQPGQDSNTQEIEQALADAMSAAKAMGKMPGNFERLVGELLDPAVDWKVLLRDALTMTVGYDCKSFKKLNRRKLAVQNLVWPGNVGFLTGGLVVGIDTSGSISQGEVTQFLSEVASIAADAKPEWLHVYWVDAEVHRIDEINNVEEVADLKPVGGGGTHMPAVFDKIDEEGVEPETCLILTDGYTGFGDPQPYRVIWGITSSGIEADHGTSIHVDVKS